MNARSISGAYVQKQTCTLARISCSLQEHADVVESYHILRKNWVFASVIPPGDSFYMCDPRDMVESVTIVLGFFRRDGSDYRPDGANRV